VLQKGNDFQVLVFVPNRYFPYGESIFNGHYVADHIDGDLMEAPARHDKAGYRGWAWSPTTVTIIDAEHFALSNNIKARRTSSERGANKHCDVGQYGRLDPARTFDYALDDLDLGNRGNAACWMYVSASQEHSEAQFYMGLMLHRGLGVASDDRQAFQWIKRSAEEGWVMGARTLSQYYFAGIGTPKDTKLATEWRQRGWSARPQTGQLERERRAGAEFSDRFARVFSGYGTTLDDRMDGYRARGMRNDREIRERAAADAGAAEYSYRMLTEPNYQPPPMPPAR
jgi:hypothetical protein